MMETHLLKRMVHALVSNQSRIGDDPHRPLWHLSPSVGLLNDPNGFIHHNGRYHLFYQWNPLACAHGAKFWGHWSSANLVHWRHEPVALVPSEHYETHGCYSGSAVVDDGAIVLIYTGNVKYDDGSRTAFQCLARENAAGEYDKLGPVLDLPPGYTGHVRDPKVWRHDAHWYMVLGAQDKQRQGKVLLFRSGDLRHWDNIAEIAGSRLGGLGDFGYMWECPDLFRLNQQEVLICCPQGIPAEGERYLNTFQAGYFVGTLDYQRGHYQHNCFSELDLGFEFYAPQTTESEDGRRLMFGWMSMPDENEFFDPTIEQGWLHTMTCPRELTLRADKLYQHPVRELQQLRTRHYTWQGVASDAPQLPVNSAEVILASQGEFQLDIASQLVVCWDGERLVLSRRNRRTGEVEHRYWRGELRQLQILFDRSSIEIFINDGVATMSANCFPDGDATLSFSGTGRLALQHWLLAPCMIE
ncbi:sucrose-6-phosphate hydrolase [Brenneria sp. 4F2]|nr:sucrose-6-phosphate hydrolase [Brenneria bubanii]